ncbi:MAG: FAD-dependent thymidylate synthase [Chloroflexi bacterium]|nr:FAD-dependent thymidylate synthase [Chloroflexota bacterium]
MPQPRRIYLLDPKHLSPETIAVAFAKTSRSPNSFDEIAAELSDEKSADFHEKWVVGYGHSSVAEHAVLHVAVENISRLAVESLESNRLASYTEKSSRYQVWSKELFHIPQEFNGHSLENEYIKLCEMLFEHYQAALEKVISYLTNQTQPLDGESERAYQQRLKSTAADSCRYYLPASALANVGMTINARAMEHAITKMLSNPLSEVRATGGEVKSVAQEIVPTLVKYADENVYLEHFENHYSDLKFINYQSGQTDWFTCVDCDSEGENGILAALLYRYTKREFAECQAQMRNLADSERERLAADLLGRLGEHDIPLRELEYAGITFDILMDQGAYYEFKRHRMMTQTPQVLSTENGFTIPKLLSDAGEGDVFRQDMQMADDLYRRLSPVFPQAASYIVPNAFNRRVLVKMNLRSALHFIHLRSAPNAHFAIRRVALRIGEEICFRYPLFKTYFRHKTDETIQTIETGFFEKIS